MRVFIDDNPHYIDDDYEGSLLERLRSENYVIPSFCVHNRLDIAGNCRMCLIQVNNDLVVSCAVNILPDMLIYTKTKRVFNARDSVLEFLLVNHPLDCPICDQGGCCDLQDLTFIFGSDRGRFYESKKRSVDNLNSCGPLIKTVMTRCIHCTRCVRFLNFYGVNELGVIGRGQNMEIGSYINKLILIEDQLSANIIDLCPVGALTSMPYAFTARPWELKSIESIDIMDSIASAIRIDIFNNKIMRILPLLDNDVNEEWITNKARFVYDSFSIQRIYYPKFKVNNFFIIISWFKAFKIFLQALFFTKIKFVKIFIGPFCDLDSAFSLKLFFNSIGCSNINYYNNLYLNVDFRSSYLLNNSLINLENLLFIILIGTNLRLELPLLNSRIRKSWINSNYSMIIYSFGLAIDYLTYPVINLSNNINDLLQFLKNKHLLCLKIFANKINYMHFFLNNFPYFFLGLGIFNRLDNNNLYNNINYYINNNLYNNSKLSVVSPFLGRISSFEFNLNKKMNNNKNKTFFYLSNIFDNIWIKNNLFFNKLNFITFSGSFKDYNILEYNLILPNPIYVENSSTYLNIEGRLRFTKLAINCKNKIYNENKIFKYLYLFVNLKYYNFTLFSNLKFIMSFFENIINYKCVFFFNNNKLLNLLFKFNGITFGSNDFYINTIDYKHILYFTLKYLNSPFYTTINNYFITDFFTKNSKILSLCASKSIIFSFSMYQFNYK